jgi:predicted dehydrogenase
MRSGNRGENGVAEASIPLRVVLVGAGGIAREHAAAIRADPRIVCAALCEPDEARRAERHAQLGGQAALFDDVHSLLEAAAGTVDAAIVCLPHHLHADAIIDCARAGLHVLCEKPLCTRLEDADRIAAALEASGVVFMAGHNQLFAPMVEEIKRRLDAGDIGALRWVRSQDCFLHPPGLEHTWRGRRVSQGGGELIDTGYHPTYTLLHYVGSPVRRVRATLARYEQPIEGEDTASVQLQFANGVIGEILSSWAFARPYGTHKVHLVGSKGQLWGTDNVLYHLRAGVSEPERIELPKVHTFTAQLAHFHDCVRGSARPLHGVAESREVLRIILAAAADADGWQDAETVPT